VSATRRPLSALPDLPNGRRFGRLVIALSWAVSTPAVAIVVACVVTMLDLTSEQWRFFFALLVGYAALASWPTAVIQARFVAGLRPWLDRRAEGSESGDAERRAAFQDVIDLPRRSATLSGASYTFPALLISGIMHWRYADWGLFETAVLALAGTAAGFVAASFQLLLAKRLAEPVREALADDLPDPAVRRQLVRRLPLTAKLLFCVTGVTVVPVIFAVLLYHDRAQHAIESFAIQWQHRVVQGAEVGGAGGDVRPGADPTLLPVALDVEVVAPGEPGPLEPQVREEIDERIAAGTLRGDSLGLPSSRVFAWRALPGGSFVLASSPRAELGVSDTVLWLVFAVLLAVSTGVAFGLAFLLARDVSRATEALRGEAERLASGDLRRGRVFESEDELGELSRSFEGMAASLRETVSRVVASADRVEGTATQMAGVSETVAGVTADQVQGLSQATASMEAIHGQVRGIAESSQALNVSVEESSSSVLELGAAGEELNETAGVLSEKVEEVSSSIEQMIRSVRQVSEGTEALSEASVETSASMEEMASAMREVDASAEQTSELGRSVVSSAERGRGKVRETMEGMEAIREATETAASVMRGLSTRTQEIGAIVDVIDDVADETNLLALNAAIIAAQAGEHGRAFSVVADEIKDLADRVLASTKEIAGLIRAVQEESQAASGAIGRGAERVAQGVDLSAEAGLALEEITGASRESGTRIAGIVSAVREQTKAAGHVAALMERVRGGVEQIRQATAEQDRGNEVVYRGSEAMREVARQVRGTTEEQARGSRRIRESVEGVREAVDRINSALQEQSAACRSALEFLETVFARTQTNEESARTLDAATKGLLAQAEDLRDHVQRFRIE